MAGFRVVILDDYQNVALRLADWSLPGPDTRCEAHDDHVADEDILVDRLKDADAVVLMRERTPVTARLIARLPRLRLILTSGMRNAAIDLRAAQAAGIVVSGTQGAGISHSTVEMTWALILAVMRAVPANDASMRAGGWQVGLGRQLHGATLGVIGLGKLGEAVARIGTAFGMNVIAWSRNLTEERARACGAVRAPDRMDLLRAADVVTIHMVLGESNRGLIGARELAAMKPGAILVNTSRGPIVETEALLAALEAGTIGGAGIDVYDTEPLPADHLLRRAPRTVLSPHLGYVTEQQYRIYYTGIVESLAAFRAGAPIRLLTA